MSVFTQLDTGTIEAVIAPLALTLDNASAATHGIENSNYLLRCRDVSGNAVGLVLTLFEQRPAQALPWYRELLTTLNARHLPVAAPITVAGKTILHVADKQAFLVPWLPGEHVFTVNPNQCHAIGALLKSLHQCPLPKGPSPHSERQQLGTLATQLADLPNEETNAARTVLDAWERQQGPRCLIHADLFRDNVLFQGDRPSGLLDLYNACEDLPVYDLAVALNDWCTNESGALAGTLDSPRHAALLAGYGAASTTHHITEALPLALTVAALRFYLSRRAAQQNAAQNPNAEGMVSKDPEPFRQMFLQRRQAWLNVQSR